MAPSHSPSTYPSTSPSFIPSQSSSPSIIPSNDPSEKPSLTFLRTKTFSAFAIIGLPNLAPLDDSAKKDFEIIAQRFLNRTKLESEDDSVEIEVLSVSILSQILRDKTNQDRDIIDSENRNNTLSLSNANPNQKILVVRIKVKGEAASYSSKSLDHYDFRSIVTSRFQTNFSNFTAALSQSGSSQFFGLEGSDESSGIDKNDGLKLDFTLIIILAAGGGFVVIVLSVAVTILCMRRREQKLGNALENDETNFDTYGDGRPSQEDGSYEVINYYNHHDGPMEGTQGEVKRYNSYDSNQRIGAAPFMSNDNAGNDSWKEVYSQGQAPVNQNTGPIHRQYVSNEFHVFASLVVSNHIFQQSITPSETSAGSSLLGLNLSPEALFEAQRQSQKFAFVGEDGSEVIGQTSLIRQASDLRSISEGGKQRRRQVTCKATPGALGIIIDSTVDGPMIYSVKPTSQLLGTLNPGDIVVGLDGIDTSQMAAPDLTLLMARKSQQPQRILTVLRNVS